MGRVSWAAHQNLQGIPVTIENNATSLLIDGDTTILQRNAFNCDRIRADYEVAWTTELSVDLLGGTLTMTETYTRQTGDDCQAPASSGGDPFTQFLSP
jgi:hypothetical protein